MKNFFEVGKEYFLDQIIEGFRFTGNIYPVVCSQNGKIKFVKFRNEMNPNWHSKSELWIHFGEQRTASAEKLANSNEYFPMFCKYKEKWKYVGLGKFKIFKTGKPAQEHVSNSEVNTILKFNLIKENALAVGIKDANSSKKTILRKKSA